MIPTLPDAPVEPITKAFNWGKAGSIENFFFCDFNKFKIKFLEKNILFIFQIYLL